MWKNSLYSSAREWLDVLLSGEPFMEGSFPQDLWAKRIVAAVMKRNPPDTVWVGAYTWTIWFASMLPTSVSQRLLNNAARLDVVEKSIEQYGIDKAYADAYGPQ